jgi:hypothetical protein
VLLLRLGIAPMLLVLVLVLVPLLLLRMLLLGVWYVSSVQTFQSDLGSVLFGIVDVLAVVPVAGRNRSALDLDCAAPSSASSYENN